jgi:hypothetical protein
VLLSTLLASGTPVYALHRRPGCRWGCRVCPADRPRLVGPDPDGRRGIGRSGPRTRGRLGRTITRGASPCPDRVGACYRRRIRAFSITWCAPGDQPAPSVPSSARSQPPTGGWWCQAAAHLRPQAHRVTNAAHQHARRSALPCPGHPSRLFRRYGSMCWCHAPRWPQRHRHVLPVDVLEHPLRQGLHSRVLTSMIDRAGGSAGCTAWTPGPLIAPICCGRSSRPERGAAVLRPACAL